MARIWNDIELEWSGDTYTVRPTLEFINHLERKPGRSLSKMFQRMMDKDLPSGAACELIADTLNFAGADVTAEQVYAETSGALNADTPALAAMILIACMPAPKDTGATGKKKPQASKRSTGEKCTG